MPIPKIVINRARYVEDEVYLLSREFEIKSYFKFSAGERIDPLFQDIQFELIEISGIKTPSDIIVYKVTVLPDKVEVKNLRLIDIRKEIYFQNGVYLIGRVHLNDFAINRFNNTEIIVEVTKDYINLNPDFQMTIYFGKQVK